MPAMIEESGNRWVLESRAVNITIAVLLFLIKKNRTINKIRRANYLTVIEFEKLIPFVIQESAFGRVQSALNQLKKRGQYYTNTAPFFLIDLRQLSIPSKSRFLNHERYKSRAV